MELVFHHYQLKRPTTLKKIHTFEDKYQIKLPKDYVYFLSEISNGGAEPDFGLYSLYELDNEDEKASDYHNKLLNLDTLYRYHHLSSKTIVRLYHKKNYETDAKRLVIILKHNLELGIQLFNHYIEGEHISAAIDVINELPKHIQPRYYHRALEILYQNIKCNQDALIKYLGNQKQVSTNDFIPLIKNYPKNSCLMIKIFDLLKNMDYLKEYELFFIHLLYDAPDYLVKTILIDILKTDKPSDALLDAYHYLYQKFPKDSYVHSIVEKERKKSSM